MHHLRSLRRLALGAALAGAAIGAVPAMANAAGPQAPTCTYDPVVHRVLVNEKSDVFGFQLARSGLDIIVGNEGFGAFVFCRPLTGSGPVANVLNTDRITVFGTPVPPQTGGCELCGPQAISDPYLIDESRGAFAPGFTPEADGNSEIEITFDTGGIPAPLEVQGTEATASGLTDTIRFGRVPGAVNGVNFGPDNDVDARIKAGATKFTASGGAGDDVLSASGNPDQSTMTATTNPVTLSGGSGNNVIAGGRGADTLTGGPNDDFFLSDDGVVDKVNGGFGFDAGIMDSIDVLTSIERRDPIGRLRLAPHTLSVRAGKPAKLSMSWTHPKAWRALRAVMLRLHDGAKPVGMINVRPRGERLTANGAVKLATGSRVTHHGKTVTARLAIRLPQSLAGHNLRVDVRATDRHGHRQLERDAGVIHVAK
jgi:hypothetical protein